MPPRIPGVQRLGTFSICLRPAVKPSTPPPSLHLPTTQVAFISKAKKRLMKQDPYRWSQMQQRKAAHEKRRVEIEAARAAALGDPVRGFTTAFVESFDSGGQAPLSKPAVDSDGNAVEAPHALPTSPHVLNHLIDRRELDAAVRAAHELTRPVASVVAEAGPDDPDADASYREALATHEMQHRKAVEVLERITHLDQGTARDRRHANIRRCIETFGRHETDLKLRPKALSRGQEREERPVRGGADTGSSEVQIAILTAKIRALANELERGRGYKDKVGKRDLRLMVHRRQRLMQYMERKERGSDRWKHMIETLGLSPATYKGQITL
ncbi:ribosomal protein S15 precursor-like protein [Xylariaceae sp. FL0662B]|nr:ribosomal protein S15 precursor-like protein [Xylariaceae sp. FL0662B]